MKEFDYDIKNIFGGLHPNKHISKIDPGVIECHNLAPLKYDYDLHKLIRHMNDYGDLWDIGTTWPWPQIYFTLRYIVAFVDNGSTVDVYELVYNDGEFEATQVGTLGSSSEIVSVNIADFGLYYVITVFYYAESYVMPWGVFDQAFEESTVSYRELYVRPSTSPVGLIVEQSASLYPIGAVCCNFKNQLIVGDIESDNEIWQELGSCSVAWSGIGNMDFDPTNDITAGFAKMPWNILNNGLVYGIRRLKNVARVYGNGGIADLVPYEFDGKTGFGVNPVESIPVLSQNSIAGDNLIHAFIDKDYKLYLSSDKEITKLDYSCYLKNLTSGRLMMNYDSTRKTFYISDGILCFVLNEYGMYSTNQCVTSIGRHNDNLYGFVKNNSDTEIRFKLSTMDLGQQSMKTIEAIEIGVNYETAGEYTVQSIISVKYDYKSDFIDLEAVILNERGICGNKVTGREFQLEFNSTYESNAEFNLSNIKVKFKQADKRNVRGRLNVA